MAIKRLFKDHWDKKIAGVFGGMGQYFNVDPNILRIIAASLIIPTGIIVIPIIYLILAFAIPERPGAYIQPTCKKLYKLERGKVFLGVCAGVADFFKVDAILIRIAFLIACFLSAFFPLAIGYLVAGSILPKK